ncbi:hypothetical protein THIOM_003355 [Candidatus Thiomargarita nelsonii]|uniref:Uncharacterized protein n=1 Tax=Candidatus Thiomargarita nelsonii TaxID=1003181 RepID=A0A176RYX8_9GAMM|nr:hypothetical protein THIOM_003355 [Candidatus Thiomargarita nelsonii]
MGYLALNSRSNRASWITSWFFSVSNTSFSSKRLSFKVLPILLFKKARRAS